MMSQRTVTWAEENGWIPFPPEGFYLPSVTCLRPKEGRTTGKIVEALRRRGYLIDNGYGKLKNRTLRIGHMGDWGLEDLEGCLKTLEEVMDRE